MEEKKESMEMSDYYNIMISKYAVKVDPLEKQLTKIKEMRKYFMKQSLNYEYCTTGQKKIGLGYENIDNNILGKGIHEGDKI